MRSLIFLAIGLLFLSAASFAAGYGEFDIRNSCGDTLWSGAAASIDIWVANSILLCGFRVPIVLSSPDGVTWQWDSQPTGWGTNTYVTHALGSRIDPPSHYFNLTGGIIVDEDYLPDGISFGGGVMLDPPVEPGPLQHWLSIHFTPIAPAEGQAYQLCLDVTQLVGLTEFGFADYGGLEIAMTFLDDNNDGIWCWPVMAYIPGDANGDRLVNIGDAIYIVNRIFRDGPPFNPTEAADANCDGSANVGDAVYLVNHIFRDGPAPCN
ncbi:MAG: hypothetical protein GYA46_04895 [candidate division Zixibacteria bacterium]|nr:hypothetical protein [candidate division Zixibacteria bacterium]